MVRARRGNGRTIVGLLVAAVAVVVCSAPVAALTDDERFTAYDDAAIALTNEVGWLVRLGGLAEPVPPELAALPDNIGLPVLSRDDMIEALRMVDRDGPRVWQGLLGTGDPQSIAVRDTFRLLPAGTLETLAAGGNPNIPTGGYQVAYGEIIDAWFPLFEAGAQRVEPTIGGSPVDEAPPTTAPLPLSSPDAPMTSAPIVPVPADGGGGPTVTAGSLPSGGAIVPRTAGAAPRPANAAVPGPVATTAASGASGASGGVGDSGATGASGAASSTTAAGDAAVDLAAARRASATSSAPVTGLAAAAGAVVAVGVGVGALRRRRRGKGDAAPRGGSVAHDDLFELSRVLPTLRTPEAVAGHAVGVVQGIAGAGASVAVIDAGLAVLAGSLEVDQVVLRPVLDAGTRVRRHAEGRAFIAAPLVTAGRVFGAVVVSRAGAAFPADVEERVGQVATLAASSLQAAFHNRDAEQLAYVDALTQVANRRRFDLDLAERLRAAHGGAEPVSLAMVDIDHFKRLNDEHGHPTGDAVLREVAALIVRHVRGADVVYRYGGEEFAILLPGADAAQAAEVVERVREAVQAHPLRGERGQELHVTVSVGVARSVADEPRDLLAAADGALYEAKGGGRNRVVIAGR